jgi:hypothetical protein
MRRFQLLFEYDELADTTSAGPFGQWFGGVGLSLALAIYAIWCLMTQRALFLSGRPIRLVQYDGLSATALGSGYLFVAAFMHLHWFWTASPRFWGYGQLGKTLAAIGVIGSLFSFLIAVLAS